jgi:hypothetical protein
MQCSLNYCGATNNWVFRWPQSIVRRSIVNEVARGNYGLAAVIANNEGESEFFAFVCRQIGRNKCKTI